MLATCGVTDVLLAYNMVGPNCGRIARLARAYPAAASPSRPTTPPPPTRCRGPWPPRARPWTC